MRFARIDSSLCAGRDRARGGFTLVEVLAALLFMAIVIPSAVEGLRIASTAGELGQRKATAGRVAERVLNEAVVTRQWRAGSVTGIIQEGSLDFRWMTRTEPWSQQSTLSLLTVEVSFPLQGRDYEVHLSTVVDTSLQ